MRNTSDQRDCLALTHKNLINDSIAFTKTDNNKKESLHF